MPSEFEFLEFTIAKEVLIQGTNPEVYAFHTLCFFPSSTLLVTRRDIYDLVDLLSEMGGLCLVIFGISYLIASHLSETMSYAMVADNAYKNDVNPNDSEFPAPCSKKSRHKYKYQTKETIKIPSFFDCE